jgi:TPR repeat protein
LLSRRKHVSMNEIFLLTDKQISELAPAAEMGDGEAAYTLYRHYAFAKVDLPRARHYLEISANAGNERAKESLRVQALNREIMR